MLLGALMLAGWCLPRLWLHRRHGPLLMGLGACATAWAFRWALFMGVQGVPKYGAGLYLLDMPWGGDGLLGIVGIFGLCLTVLVVVLWLLGLKPQHAPVALHGDPETAATYTRAFRGWLEGDPASRLPGGENYLEVLQRSRPVLEELASRDGVNVLVSHGAAIRTVARWASGVTADYAFDTYLANGRTVILDPSGRPFGEWGVVSWG